MECKECGPLLSRAVDGELDAAQRANMEAHLQACAACSRERDNLVALRSALKNKALSFAAPEELKARLRAQAAGQAQQGAPRRPSVPWWRGLAAALVCLGLASWSFAHFTAQSEQSVLAQEVVGAHIRSLMASHLSDVISTDMHTVKPWFAGKLDFSPLVTDFPEKEFNLVGGRLDYLHGRAVAALIYKHRQHVINVFTWPADTNVSNALTAKNGYNVVNWRQDTMEFWMVSDLNASELAELKALIQQKDAR